MKAYVAYRTAGSLALLAISACSGHVESTSDDLSASSVGPAKVKTDETIEKLIEGISATSITEDVTRLVSFGTRNSCSDGLGTDRGIVAARDWLTNRFAESDGLKVKRDSFPVACPNLSISRHNVYALKTGRDPKRLIVVGGHYDSRSHERNDGTGDAPGANDSGSQTSLVLAVARALSSGSFEASIAFVSFAGEEQDLLGSRAFISHLPSLIPGARIEAMLNADIVGGDNTANDETSYKQYRVFAPGTPRDVVGDGDGTADTTSPSRALLRYVATWGSAYVPQMEILPNLREDRPGRGSDHQSFVARGYPAVRFIEAKENHAHQHSDDDRLEYITPEYTARVSRVVAATAASLASAPVSPDDIKVTADKEEIVVHWSASPRAKRYVVAIRSAEQAMESRRITADGSKLKIRRTELGDLTNKPFFVSVAAVDAAGHESLFSFPEPRCEGNACKVSAAALQPGH